MSFYFYFRKLSYLAKMATSAFLPILLLAVAGISEGKVPADKLLNKGYKLKEK